MRRAHAAPLVYSYGENVGGSSTRHQDFAGPSYRGTVAKQVENARLPKMPVLESYDGYKAARAIYAYLKVLPMIDV